MPAGATRRVSKHGHDNTETEEGPVERATALVVSVTRKVDSSRKVCFAGYNWTVGKRFIRQV